ncbi:DUF3592 domain-containing protein [Myxococcus sp. AB025B]|uniref:DUF3592 domain-containing protein n=1 Tax=Myxococcus sp. AB025B TaxID=2562794 RepID=UPI00114317A5|nr:DUF3592 domain-containing protein [Myxococcus sp. AB025B]
MSSSSRVGSAVVLLVVVSLWWALTGFADHLVGSNVRRQIQSASWPTVQGTITASEVESVRRARSTTHGLKLTYTYFVDGQQHEGHNHRVMNPRSGRLEEAQALAAQYPVGARVTVHHAPGDPSRAVLQAGLGGAELVLLLLLPFNLVALWLLKPLVQAFKPEPPLLSPFAREDGSECVHLDAPGTATSAAITMAAAALLCFVFTSILAGGNPPLPAGVAAWGVVIACGLFVGRHVHARKKAGHYEVRLHRREQSLSLPPIPGRKARLDVRWKDVLSLRVESQASAKNKTRYRATLEIATADGTARREAVCGDTGKDRAEALARWLRKDLQVGEVALQALRSA